MFRKIICVLLVSFVLISFSGCEKKEIEKEVKIKIALQYGLAYAPLHIMKEKGLLEKEIENLNVSWVLLPNTTAIREAMLNDDLDIGFVGIPPFLIGVNNNMDWKIIKGISISPLALLTNEKRIKTIEDFK